MMNPLISIITPTFNHEKFIAQCIESVLKQTYKHWEMIIIDDGSIDNTADIARSYQNLRYMYQTNQGLGAARNAGIVAAQGEFIAFLDADDLWTKNKNELQMTAFHANPHADIVTGYVKQFYSPEMDESERKKYAVLMNYCQDI